MDRLADHLGIATAAAPQAPPSDAPAAAPPAAAPVTPVDAMAAVSEAQKFHSVAIDREVRYHVWRPAAPGAYPLVLLLHGAGATHRAYVEHLDDELTAIAAKERVVLVAPHGSDWGDSWWLDGPRRLGADYEKMIADDLIPHLEKQLGTTAARGAVGYSMGGHGAISLAMRRPGLFAAVGSMSGALDLTEAGSREALQKRLGMLEDSRTRPLWEERSVLQLIEKHPDRARALAIRMTCGTQDKWIGANRNVHAALEKHGIAHEYAESNGGHDWDVWARETPEHVRWVIGKLR